MKIFTTVLSNYLTVITLFILSFVIPSQAQDVLFHEDFESPGTGLPSGWINLQMSTSIGEWKTGIGAGEFTSGQIGLPDTAAQGEKNAYFRVPSPNPQVVRMISPPIDLEFAVFPELTFWHAQYPRNGSYSRLVVYFAEDLAGPWFVLANYQNPVYQWTHRTFQLPSGIPALYLAFEGHSGAGTPGSVCVDDIIITETGEMQRFLSGVQTTQPNTAFIPTGSQSNPILRTEFRVMGNTGDVFLEQFTANSLNTDDNDIAPQGVKLWFTTSENFNEPVLLANGKDFLNGTITFDNLQHSLPTGYSYAWLTYDIDNEASHGHFAQAYIPSGSIIVNGEAFPDTDHSPPGKREIRKTLFYEDFDTDKGWLLSGEWQREVPQGLGGYNPAYQHTQGPAGASFAYSGNKVLGTDLTGLGEYPGNYEPHLIEHAWQAIMPVQDFFYHNNLTLSFQRWLNVYFFDRATIDISTNNGVTWENVWTNQLVNNASGWSQVSYALPQAARKENVLIRFTLGDTGGTNLQSGWNIDQLVITGTFVTTDVGVAEIYSPRDNCGMTDQEIVSVKVMNYGAEASPQIIPMAFSLDGGSTWQRDTLYGSIPVGGSQEFTFAPRADFSVPGRYNNVLIKTELPEDQDPSNDQLHTGIFSIPTYQPEISSDFEQNDEYWSVKGANASWHRTVPAATEITAAYEGNYAWVTNGFGNYNASELSWIESPCYDFSDVENPALDFFLTTHTPQGMDGAAVDYSLDGGHSWQRMDARSHDLSWDWYNQFTINSLLSNTGNGSGWTGSTNGWINPRLVLPEETSFQPAVRLRLVFASNPVEVPYEGIAFDMISVYPTPNDIGVTAFIEPQSDCELAHDQHLTIEIGNLGINILPVGTIIPLGIDDHGNNLTFLEEFTLETDLAPGEYVSYTFMQTFDMHQSGNYSFTAYTLLEENPDFWNDHIPNDSLTTTITVFGYPTVNIGDDLFTINPDSILLDAGPGFVSYVWQDGSSSQTFQIDSPHTLLYHVTVTDDNGCSASDSILVKTYDLGISALASPVNDCLIPEGVNIKAELINNGHDPFPSGMQVAVSLFKNDIWIEDIDHILENELLPGEISIAEFTTVTEVMESGQRVYTLIHHFEDANPDNDHLSATVTAYGFPEIFIGDYIYTTQPDTITLDPGPGFASYLWQDGSTAQTFNVTDSHTATYWVRVTDQNGCSTQDEVHVITFDADIIGLVSPADDCLFEEQQQITILLVNNGIDSFEPQTSFTLQLLVNSEFIAQETFIIDAYWEAGTSIPYTFGQTVNMLEPGTYNVEAFITEQNGIPSNKYFTTQVTSTGYPVIHMPGIIITSLPDTLVLDAGTGHHSYLWNTGHTGQTLQVTDWGTYSVTVSNSIGCETYAATEVVPEAIDLSISGLLSPEDGCMSYFFDVPVTVTITNEGNVTIPAGEQMTLIYQAGEMPGFSEHFSLSEDLMPGENTEYTFSENLYLTKTNVLALQVWVEHPEDENPDNDLLQEFVNIFPMPRPDLGDTIYNATPAGMILTPQEPYQSYMWHDGSTDAEFLITSPFSEWYTLTVTDFNGCIGTDSVKVIAYDLELTDLLSPIGNCTLSTSENVAFRFRNNGPDHFYEGHSFSVGISLNNSPMAEHQIILSDTFSPGEELEYEFPQTYNLSSSGDYSFRIKWMQPDVNNDNNEIIENINVPGVPYVNLGPNISTSQPDTITLFAGYGFESYLWQDGNTSPYFDVYHFGWHWVVVTDHYGCTGSDTLYIGMFTGIDDPLLYGPQVAVYPNPASRIVTVKASSSSSQPMTLELWNQNGILLLRKEIPMPGILEEKIEIEGLPAGVYYVRVMENNIATVKKLIISPG